FWLPSRAQSSTGLTRALSSLRAALFSSSEPASTAIYTLSLHDALPISHGAVIKVVGVGGGGGNAVDHMVRSNVEGVDFICANTEDRKSTRLNSSHVKISYAVFCLKKKKSGEYDYSRVELHNQSVELESK